MGQIVRNNALRITIVSGLRKVIVSVLYSAVLSGDIILYV